MLAKFVAVVLLGLALAAPEGAGKPETRQVFIDTSNPNCPDSFHLTTNPCQSGQGRVYYPLSGDPSKFVQCDVLGRAYVVQCPPGLYYNAATTSCQAQQLPLATTQQPLSFSVCNAQALQTGQVYFPYPGDNSHFYECTALGQVQVLQCPHNLVWDGSRIACVYPAQAIIGVLNPTVYPHPVQFNNPCTAQHIAGNHYYFAHPDPTKFIQCDDAGEAFVVACPSGLVWNQYLETCSSAFAQSFGSVVGK